LYVFIENQDYTLADVPQFLTDKAFRHHLLRNVKHKPEEVDFWTRQFQERYAESAMMRLTTFLGHDVVKHIVGQRTTTLDFGKIMQERKIVLVRLPATLAPDIKTFIGTLFISELVHAVQQRVHIPEAQRHQFCIFVDEFQHFVNYEDFGTLLEEARKYGVATTIAHVERFGQLGDNKHIIGATGYRHS
jgi:type IV secretory pathway TraG/TraD family ATPase VirD4